MATEVNVRRLAKSWQYDFKLRGYPRQRKGGFRTKHDALSVGRSRLDQLVRGAGQMTLDEAFRAYLTATTMKDRSRDYAEQKWERIEPVLGHMLIEEVDTMALDGLKLQLPKHLGPASINHHLRLVGTILRFKWKRGKLSHLPYIPTVKVPKKHAERYTTEERDQLLDGMFRLQPRWYLFFYLSCRLGLRASEVYALSHRQVRHVPPQLIIDQQVQRGTKKRPPKLITRKNDEAYSLEITQDVLDAINWHIAQGYAGDVFLFCKGDTFHWLRRFAKQGRKFDAVVLDPPTFSRDEKGKVFRVEQNFGGLAALAANVLTPDGFMLCCTNFRAMTPWEFERQLLTSLPRPMNARHSPMPPDFTDKPYLKSVWLR